MKVFFSRSILIVLAGAAFSACHHKAKPVDNTAPAWYKNQIIYNLDVKTFKDSDGDGIGDFKGLTSRLGYLDSMGVTAIWLAPFQPSPWQDDGYDVADYYAIDKRVGTLNDFNLFVQALKRHHMRLIMDLVLNHSSTQHPWFRSRPDWYLWSDKRPRDWNKGMGFPVVEKETWRYDSVSRKYYFHRFYRFEPDLNYQNIHVLAEAERILGYWLNKGVDGFRLDAVPFIIDDPRRSAESPDHDFYILQDLARYVKKIRPDAMLLGEANIKPNETKDYFGRRGDGLDMMLNFEVNEYLFYAFATGDTGPLYKALDATAVKPGPDQWVYFLRNHDEIDLGKLSGSQRKEVFSRMAPDTNMQLYKRGIRRRLAPMMNNDMSRLKQAYSLVFALPGTPALRYGEEIGMGDDMALKERLSVRTPMQWDTTNNGGFSAAAHTFRPLISSGIYGFRAINATRQLADSSSLLTFIRRMIQLRKMHPEIGAGRWQLQDGGNGHCLIINYTARPCDLLIAYNFSARVQQVTLPGNTPATATDLVNGGLVRFTTKGDKKTLSLPPYAGYWLDNRVVCKN